MRRSVADWAEPPAFAWIRHFPGECQSRSLITLMDGLVGGTPLETPDPLTLDEFGLGDHED